MGKILLTVDGSPFAERALDIAIDLAQQRRCDLTLLRVLVKGEREQAEAYLNGLKERAEAHHITAQALLLEGDPTEKILEQSESHDLLVMTSHGHSQFDQLILGSVTEKVSRRAKCPVFVLRDRQLRLRDIRKVMVPLDGSEFSESALAEAQNFCQGTGASLLLARVDEAVGVEIGLVSRDEESRLMDGYLQGVKDSINTDIEVEVVHDFGSAARSLLKLVDREGVDLVVMCSHGRGGFNRWVSGSVAENVLRASLAPVMIVRARS